MAYKENVVKHLSSTLLGAMLIIAGISIALISQINCLPMTWTQIVTMALLLIAGLRLLGAESLATEYAKLAEWLPSFRKK